MDYDENGINSDGIISRELSTQKQLRLSDLVHALMKHVVLIAVCMAAGLVIGIVLSIVSYMRGEMSKQYAIKASIAVTAQNESGLFTAQSNNPNMTDIQLAENIVDAVIYVMKSDTTLNAAANRLELLGISTRDIYNNLSLKQYNETQIIELTLYWRSAQEGIDILNAIMAVAPDILIDALKIGNVRVINPPTSKYLIGGNINASVWVYMAALGAMLGAGIALLQLLIHPTLTNVRDMEKVFALEVLGEIPERKAYFRKKHNLLVANEDSAAQADVTDNFASLAHIVKSRIKRFEHPCLYVTSASQGEGKTTVTANLAVQLSELGLKVLVVDFDVRNPKLGGFFLSRIDYVHSINALYRGETDMEEAVTNLTGTLDVLPAVLERQPIPLDDATLDLARSLKEKYDLVLIDTAPVGLVADTMSLNQLADVALFVVSYDNVGLQAIRDSLERLDKSGMPIIGCIVNGVKNLNPIKKTSSYGYGYGYGTYSGGSTRRRKKTQKSERQEEWEAWERRREEMRYEQQNRAAEDQIIGSEDAIPIEATQAGEHEKEHNSNETEKSES